MKIEQIMKTTTLLRLFGGILPAAILAVAALTSCDDIKEGDRYIKLPEVAPARSVLVEDFTGQLCSNCPRAHAVIDGLQEQYGENVIAVAIHAGPLSMKEIAGTNMALGIAEGDTYADAAGVTSYPKGRINRTTGPEEYEAWAGIVREQLSSESSLKMEVEASYNAADNKVEISTLLHALDPVAGKLQLWVVESGIVAPQTLPDGSMDMNYVHNHVFRGCVNGVDGENVNVTVDADKALNHSVAVKSNWNPANLGIVAFVYNDAGVQQVTQCHVSVAE